MFLNDNQYFYVYLYWGKCPLGQIRPPPCKSLPQKIFLKNIVTNKSQKMFFYKYFYTRAFRG